MKIKQKLMILMCVSALIMSSCNSALKSGYKDEADTATQTQTSVLENQVTDIADLTNDTFDEDDLAEEGTTDAGTISFGESKVTADGDGMESDDSTATITKAGTYTVSGTTKNGQLVVDAGDSDVVHIVLNGATITSKDNGAIYVKNAGKTVITVAEGTTNALEDAAKYSDENCKGVISANGNLTFNGNGVVTIKGNNGNGIYCAKDLKLACGTYDITAAGNGLYGKDGISIKNGSYTLKADQCGMLTESEDASLGFIGIEGGNFALTTKNDGISASGAIYLANGSYTYTTGEGSKTTSSDSGWGDWGTKGATAKGIKSASDITIYGGSLTMDTADDCIYATKGVTVYSGSVTAASGDDGIVSGDTLEVEGGSIVVSKSYEGICCNGMNVTGGYINLTCEDDGINLAGGNDKSAASKRAGANDVENASSGTIAISAAYVNINASGDGIDANGDFTLTDGSVQICAAEGGKGNVVDASGAWKIDGGMFLGVSSEKEEVLPSTDSQQNVIVLDYAKEQAKDAVVYVTDNTGNAVTCYAPAKKFNHVVISKTDLAAEQILDWSTGKVKDSSTTGDVSADNIEAGDKICEFKVATGITQVDKDGVVK